MNSGFYGFSPSTDPSDIVEPHRWMRQVDVTGQTYNQSGYYATSPGSKAFDLSTASDGNAWMSNGVNTNQWVSIQFGSTKVIVRLLIKNGAPQSANRAAKNCLLEGSNDGATWVRVPAKTWYYPATKYLDADFTLANDTGTSPANQVIDFENETGYAYYRVYCYDNYGDGYLAIAEIAMYEAI